VELVYSWADKNVTVSKWVLKNEKGIEMNRKKGGLNDKGCTLGRGSAYTVLRLRKLYTKRDKNHAKKRRHARYPGRKTVSNWEGGREGKHTERLEF